MLKEQEVCLHLALWLEDQQNKTSNIYDALRNMLKAKYPDIAEVFDKADLCDLYPNLKSVYDDYKCRAVAVNIYHKRVGKFSKPTFFTRTFRARAGETDMQAFLLALSEDEELEKIVNSSLTTDISFRKIKDS